MHVLPVQMQHLLVMLNRFTGSHRLNVHRSSNRHIRHHQAQAAAVRAVPAAAVAEVAADHQDLKPKSYIFLPEFYENQVFTKRNCYSSNY